MNFQRICFLVGLSDVHVLKKKILFSLHIREKKFNCTTDSRCSPSVRAIWPNNEAWNPQGSIQWIEKGHDWDGHRGPRTRPFECSDNNTSKLCVFVCIVQHCGASTICTVVGYIRHCTCTIVCLVQHCVCINHLHSGRLHPTLHMHNCLPRPTFHNLYMTLLRQLKFLECSSKFVNSVRTELIFCIF